MKHLGFRALLALALALGSPAHAFDRERSPPTDNPEILSLYEAGQQERQALFSASHGSVEAREAAESALWKRDLIRRDAVLKQLREHGLSTAADYWRAAFVLQHSPDLGDIQLAYSLATIAVALAPERKQYRWLAAAAWDRILTSKRQPQWFGTQFQPDPVTGQQVQAPVADSAVTDQERIEWGVPTLEESRRMLESINAPRAP